GRWLGTGPGVLLLDEPTRGVDVGAKEELYTLIQRLAGEGRALVLISSELPEVAAQSDRVGVFREGRLVATFDPRATSPEEIAAAALPTHEGPPVADQGSHVGGGAVGPAPFALRASPSAQWLREAALLLFVVGFFGVMQALTGSFLRPDSVRGLLADAALLSF